MTHTAALHARAAAHSLGDALTRLRHAAAAEAAHIACEGLYAADGLRSTTYGVRYGSGGHSDPTATTYLVHDRPFQVNRSQALYDDLTEQLRQLAAPLPGAGTPLDRIHAAIPRMRADIAQAAACALHRLDEVARRHLHIGPARRSLSGPKAPACPVCGIRNLHLQTAGPQDAWTVVCDGEWRDGRLNPCLCVGPGCPCGVDGAVPGVAHIWPRDAVIGAVAGAAPTQPAN
ncbi:hypothetical protein ACGF5C_31635 [Micromonospora sp. NPDC047620]|uniref:hypothetical protein n=1 Tax=Micromonospora sp. NPDC047620 TaxID=3364251 RepID=UPI0037181690